MDSTLDINPKILNISTLNIIPDTISNIARNKINFRDLILNVM
jgi:hypothetical protein